MARKGKSTVEIVTELALPVAERLGVEVWDVRFEKEGSAWYLRILIDKEDGSLTIDDCVEMNRAMDTLLDEVDPIEPSYNLEVSSPGIERDLTKRWHRERYLGEQVRLRLYRAQNGKREYIGTLEEVTDEGIVLRVEGETIPFDNKDITWLRVYYDFDAGE